MKNDYKAILNITQQAQNAWLSDAEMNESIQIAFDHLKIVLIECQKSSVYKNDVQRRKDFLYSISAIIRCALHYQILAQNGCFDDARIFMRKAMEIYAVATACGYDDSLYNKWTKEEFTKPGKGFAYLSKQLLNSSTVPKEEKEHIKWMLGQSDIFPGPHQYGFLSESSVHGLSCKVLRNQINPDDSFKLDISHIKSDILKQKMYVIVTLFFNAANLVLEVFKYVNYVKITGITPIAEKIRLTNNLLMKKLLNQKTP